MACCFIYYTAIRPGTELRLMKFNQINFQSRTITVRNELSKNSKTETIDIPENLYHLLVDKWNLNTYDSELYIFGQNRKPGLLPLGKNTMRWRFNKFRDKLNLPKSIKFYSWKHSGAQELADRGASIYEIQRHLRHRDMTTTESYLRKRIGQRSNAIKHHFPDI
jgi:integrase